MADKVKYPVNQGNRQGAVRVGLEPTLKQFIEDYARDIGMSHSAACRRLILIGARCEVEHGKSTMPISYDNIFYDPNEAVKSEEPEIDWDET